MCSNCKIDGSCKKDGASNLGGDGGKNVIFFFKWQE
jgi:hypothetical protein